MRSVLAQLRTALVATAAVAMAACATGPEIRRDTNPAANFASYRTFAFFSPLATDKAGYESVFTSRMKEATRRAMEAKGYVYSEANPDLLVNFFANVRLRQEIRSTPSASMGYYGYRGGMYGGFGISSIDTVTYREGTLAIDLVEAKRKLLAWQAVAEGTVSEETRRNPGPVIDAVVAQMMSELPPAGGK